MLLTEDGWQLNLMPKINKETTLAEVLENPKAGEVLLKHRIPCLSCPFANLEMNHLTLEEISKMYGLNLKSLIADLNEV